MIELDNLQLRRGGKLLFEGASLRIAPGEKVALVGANGSGKSSLFKLLLGELEPDAGHIAVPRQWQLAHMAQEVDAVDQPALEFVLSGDRELTRIQGELEHCEDPQRLAELHQALDDIDGYTAPQRAEQLLVGLGFAQDELRRPVSSFSGGWRIRLNLGRALMCRSDLLLLDEPTNHLDLDACLWLETWLARYPGTLVLISHDRDFIDTLCGRVLHIEHRELKDYRGNYSDFERQRAERLAQQAAEREKQQRRVAEIERFVARFRAKATKAKQAQSRLKELARMELIAPAHVDSPFSFRFAPAGKTSDPLLAITQGAAGYPDHQVLSGIELAIHPGSRLGLLGANGAGKSTLLRTLAGAQPLLAGERIEGEHLRLGYFTQHQLESLDSNASPALHIQRISPRAREQEIRDFLGGFNFHGDAALEPIRDFSGGEKARLALALIVWQRPNLLLLDEPTNHLDLDMCHALTVALQGFEGAVVLISHDRHLIRNTCEELLLVADGRVQPYDGDLDDYRQWLLARSREQNAAPTADKGVSKKEARQQAAAARQKLKPLRDKLKKSEAALDRLERELAQIETKLADSGLYEPEQKEALQSLLQHQGELRQQREVEEENWFALQEELETLKTEVG